jgi:hypothetical protein
VVETETGTKHLRDIEKQRAQASGNQDLQITKALTAKRKPDESGPDIEAAIGYNQLSKLSDDVSPVTPPTNVDFVPQTEELGPVDQEFAPVQGQPIQDLAPV